MVIPPLLEVVLRSVEITLKEIEAAVREQPLNLLPAQFFSFTQPFQTCFFTGRFQW